MNMEKEHWITAILNSTNGITKVAPGDDLLFKIQTRIRQEAKVSPKIVWLVAATVAILVMLNITVINSKSNPKKEADAYLEMTVNKNNQLY